MTNPLNAPDEVFVAIQTVDTDLAAAILKLGHKRVQWCPNGSKGGGPSMPPAWAPWTLDGKQARVGEIIAAAKESGHVG